MPKRLLTVAAVALALAGCSAGRDEGAKPTSGGDAGAAAKNPQQPPGEAGPAPAEYRREDRSIVVGWVPNSI